MLTGVAYNPAEEHTQNIAMAVLKRTTRNSPIIDMLFIFMISFLFVMNLNYNRDRDYHYYGEVR